MSLSEDAVRSDALGRYDILNTPPEPSFDRITRLAASALGRPVGVLALADRDRFWFKSKHGVNATEMPRQMAFCEETIAGDGVFVVSDALRDARFADAPVVRQAPYVRFYAGAPIVTSQGVRIGSLCVLDQVPVARFSQTDRSVLTDLASTVMELIEGRAHQIELARCTTELAHLARHDVLTGLPNRRRLIECYDRLRQAKADAVAVLYIDLDGFKAVNDRRGHACGDAVLREVSDRIRLCLPSRASVARIGGDEFAVLLPASAADLRVEAAALGDRLIERLGRPYKNAKAGGPIGCSIGLAIGSADTGLDVMLAQADAALYRVKSRGGGGCLFADERGSDLPIAGERNAASGGRSPLAASALA